MKTSDQTGKNGMKKLTEELKIDIGDKVNNPLFIILNLSKKIGSAVASGETAVSQSMERIEEEVNRISEYVKELEQYVERK